MTDEAKTPPTVEYGPESVVEKYDTLLPGKALTLKDVYEITALSRARVILLAGMPKSGKTTLIASLFHAFQRGPLAGFAFAGSRTLLGFDARCHDARVSSRRSSAATERTKTEAAELLLHLQVRKDYCSSVTDLLFVDMSGEHYEAVRDSVDECKNVPLIRRADHFVLLVDGERLADLAQRQKARTDARMLMRSCFDSGEMKPTSLVDVLVTKWDTAQTSATLQEVTAFSDAIEKELAALVSAKCSRFRFARVAARPTTTILPVGWGMEEIFSKWVADVPELFHSPKRPSVQQVHTEFDRLRVTTND